MKLPGITAIYERANIRRSSYLGADAKALPLRPDLEAGRELPEGNGRDYHEAVAMGRTRLPARARDLRQAGARLWHRPLNMMERMGTRIPRYPARGPAPGQDGMAAFGRDHSGGPDESEQQRIRWMSQKAILLRMCVMNTAHDEGLGRACSRWMVPPMPPSHCLIRWSYYDNRRTFVARLKLGKNSEGRD